MPFPRVIICPGVVAPEKAPSETIARGQTFNYRVKNIQVMMAELDQRSAELALLVLSFRLRLKLKLEVLSA